MVGEIKTKLDMNLNFADLAFFIVASTAFQADRLQYLLENQGGSIKGRNGETI